MKGLSMSTHSAVIVPSPIFLWRFKVALSYLNENEFILRYSHATQIRNSYGARKCVKIIELVALIEKKKVFIQMLIRS